MRAHPGIAGRGRAMTLWADFLRRMMVGATLSGPAAAAAAEGPGGQPTPAEVGEPSAPDRAGARAAAPEREAAVPGG